MISAFLSQGDELGQDPLDVSAPQANAYEFQSSGIVDMLEKLKDKFEDLRGELEKEEMDAKHASPQTRDAASPTVSCRVSFRP